MKPTLFAVLLLASAAGLRGGILYDVNFSAATDTIGQPATTGGLGPVFARPSSVQFGTSQVLDQYPGLPDRPLSLIPEPFLQVQYSQYQFGISAFDRSPIYTLDFDLVLDRFTGRDAFSVLFDIPNAHSLDFDSSGVITTFAANPNTPALFEFGRAFHISVMTDLPRNQWQIFKDGLLISSGAFARPISGQTVPPTVIRTIRFNLSDDRNSAGTPVAVIDNIRISAIPEPSTALFGLILAAVAVFPDRRKIFASRRIRTLE